VVITQGLCSDTSACIQITTVGIAKVVEGFTAIYPNPVSDELVIENKGVNDKIYFEIYNAIGQMVFSGNFTGKTIVQTSAFPTGVYLIKLSAGKTVEIKKIIKE
jgi:hypothetical protein